MTATELEVTRVLPAPKRIVVRLHKRSERTAGGLIIPGGPQEVATIGQVVEPDPPMVADDGAVGHSLYEIGDWVVFGKFNGTEVKVGSDTLVVVPVSEVACRLLVKAADSTEG